MRCLAALLLLCVGQALAAAGIAPAEHVDLAPYRALDLAGREQPLGQLRGRPLLLNVWARWCAPCRQEMPLLSAAQARHPRVQFVGLALDDDHKAVADFARAYELQYRILLSGAAYGSLLEAIGNADASLPYTLALDAEGRVLYRHRGVLDRASLSQAVRLLDGSGSAAR